MVLSAKDYGVPQNRPRIFIVLWREDVNITNFVYPSPMKTKTRVGDILEANVPESFTISDKLWEGHQRRKSEHEQKGNGFGYSMFNEEYEEYAIHDTDNFPIAIGEYVSIEELNEMYEMIEELPDYIVECLDEFISHYGTLEEVVEHKDDIYYYPDCETMTDVAYYYIDELQALGDIPPSLQNYIDYEAYGRDLDMGGCFIETSRGMCEIPY